MPTPPKKKTNTKKAKAAVAKEVKAGTVPSQKLIARKKDAPPLPVIGPDGKKKKAIKKKK
jgi:hypothetical protein